MLRSTVHNDVGVVVNVEILYRSGDIQKYIWLSNYRENLYYPNWI